MPLPDRPRRRALTALTLALVLGACGGAERDPSEPTSRQGSAPGARDAGRPPTAGDVKAARLTLREKAGQVIVASWAGHASPAPLVRRLHLGGVVALESNIASPAQIRRVNRSVDRVVSRRGHPAFLAVDQEGGLVNRVNHAATAFPAFMSAGAADDEDLTRRAANASAAEMRALGFDVVLAPVADVTSGDLDAVIGSRSAGGRPRLVARHVLAATRGVGEAGVLPVVKHFPGHGSLTVDSHEGLPVQRRPVTRLRTTDLVPFTAAAHARVPAIMTGHVAVRALDRGVPASISRRVTTGLLRHQMGYEGLVVTDALDMQGVQRVARGGRAAVGALRAGADVVLMPPDAKAARDRIVQAVRAGRLSESRLEDAAARMIDTLLELRDGQQRTRARRPGSSTPASLALSRAALTSVAGPCRGRVIADRVRVVGPAAEVQSFNSLIRDRGVTVAHDVRKRVRVGTRTVVVGHRKRWVRKKVVDDRGETSWKRVRKRVAITRRVPVRRWVTIPADAPTVALVGAGAPDPGASDVLVSLDRPGVLGRVEARVELAAYGSTPQTLRAVADVLVGSRTAPGRLPLHVPGAGRTGCPT